MTNPLSQKDARQLNRKMRRLNEKLDDAQNQVHDLKEKIGEREEEIRILNEARLGLSKQVAVLTECARGKHQVTGSGCCPVCLTYILKRRQGA